MECLKKIEKIWKKIKGNKCLLYIRLLLFVFLSSCTDKYCDAISRSLEEQCREETEECSVSFKKTFDFRWDTLYIFDSMLYPQEISKELGVEYNGDIVPEGKRLFIFVRNGDIFKKQVSTCSNVLFLNKSKKGIVKILYEEIYIMKRKTVYNEVEYLIDNK